MEEFKRTRTVAERQNQEGIDNRTARLSELVALAKELPELERLAENAADAGEYSPATDRLSEVSPRIAEGLAFMRDSLAEEKYFGDALSFYFELHGTERFKSDARKTIIDALPIFRNALEHYSPYASRVIDLMQEVYLDSVYAAREAQAPDVAENIRGSIRDLEEVFTLYFSQANLPSASERKGRLGALQSLSNIVDIKKTPWILDAMANNVTSLILSKEYAPHISSKLIFDMLDNRERQIKKITDLPKDAVTRLDVESCLSELPDRQYLQVIQKILAQLGLPTNMPRELVKQAAFEVTGIDLRFIVPFNRIFDQFDMVHALELERPGSAKTLHERFGIRWFSRYPLWTLIKQYDERDVAEKPYGVFLSATVDTSRAFFSKNDRTVVASVMSQLSDCGHSLRIIECETRSEIADKLANMHSTYGVSHAMSFLFIRAHANKGLIDLSLDPDEGDIDMTHLDDAAFVASLNHFTEHPTIILDVCGVGRRGGIGQKLSDAFSATTYTPKGRTSTLVAITITSYGNNLSFTPQYQINKRTEITSAAKYVSGRRR